MGITRVTAHFVLVKFLVVLMVQAQAHPDWASETLTYKRAGHEKETKLHFYLHDTVSGKNATSIRVAEAPSTNKSRTFFGAVVVMDAPLTAGPDPNSELLGRAQGLYGFSGQEEISLIMGISLVFTSECRLNGSTLSVLTRNPVSHTVREFSIVGGTGYFKLARGFIKAKTYLLNLTTGGTIVEYTCTVIHY